jgi:hypothetical protein
MTPPTTEQKRKEAVAIHLKDMGTTAGNMRGLIVGMPPKDLLGYIYAQRMMKVMAGRSQEVPPGLWILGGLSLCFFIFYPY